MEYNPKGVIVSNGPGDPQRCTDYLDTIKQICNSPIPTLGICLGHQLISLSLGASTYKLPYGHRGQNKSCHDLVSDRSYVTSQNHGYAVDIDSLSNTELKPWFVNLDDNSLEGVIMKIIPVLQCNFIQKHILVLMIPLMFLMNSLT